MYEQATSAGWGFQGLCLPDIAVTLVKEKVSFYALQRMKERRLPSLGNEGPRYRLGAGEGGAPDPPRDLSCPAPGRLQLPCAERTAGWASPAPPSPGLRRGGAGRGGLGWAAARHSGSAAPARELPGSHGAELLAPLPFGVTPAPGGAGDGGGTAPLSLGASSRGTVPAQRGLERRGVIHSL